MGNEAKTENLVRDILRGHGYYDNPDIIVEEKKSDNPIIAKLLKNASKQGSGAGYPEFIIRSNKFSNFLIVIECKADIMRHESKELDNYAEYAVDGALLYGIYLAEEYDVLAIGVSGEHRKDLKISHYLYLKGNEKSTLVLGHDLLSFQNYYDEYTHNPQKFNQDYQSLLDYSRDLNELLHSQKIVESQRSLLISGILIALQNDAFRQGYRGHNTAKQLTDHLVNTIVNQLQTATLSERQIANLRQAFSFITTHATLSMDKEFTVNLITEISQRIDSFLKTYEYIDTIGHFYVEFLRYANNDKGLGIVLTPMHITELFVELANINKNSIVIDNCCGTGGFLIAAMKKMTLDARGNQKKIADIKNNQVVGIEFQDHIYALAVSNMVIHGDGKTNIYQGNCFELVEKIRTQYKPNVGLLNPPYKVQKGRRGDVEELRFILNNLDMLEPNGKCIAIVPMNRAVSYKGTILELKKMLLNKHTLEAVMSMPNELFHDSDIGEITCAMVFTAHVSHPKGKKTWFGYWKDDMFVKVRNKGRVDKYNKWANTKSEWVNSFNNKETKPNMSVMREVAATDEWCAEAYMDTDYSKLRADDFIKYIKNYVAYIFLGENVSTISNSSVSHRDYLLDTTKWKYFRCNSVFDSVQVAKSIDLNKLDIAGNSINYVGRTRENNGITAKVLPYSDEFINEGNCITIPMVGESTCFSFYQNQKFYSSQNILVLRSGNLNIYNALFINGVIRLERFRFSYGRTLTKQFFQQHHIKLPSTVDSKVDWQFMEDYIKSLPYSSNL